MIQIQVGDAVVHKNFGIGDVTDITESRIIVQFAGVSRHFEYPASFESGLLCLHQSREMIDAVQRIPMVFLNIAWMKCYKGQTTTDVPINGGSYVDKNMSGAEEYNFAPINLYEEVGAKPVRYMLGYYATKSTGYGSQNQMRIERVIGSDASPTDEDVDGILVVWCATPKKGPSHVVGWYQYARLYRNYQFSDDEEDNVIFNVSCLAEDAVLLPLTERVKPEWEVPRAAGQGAAFGFGQANVWYASEPNVDRYVKRMIHSIQSYRGNNAI